MQAPVFEKVISNESETFLWRRDDYPWVRNVWNFHPEYEIHLVRNASGIALIGDYAGLFEPGYLTVIGGGLPHDWVTPIAPGELIEKRDIVLQFDPERIRAAAGVMPEFGQIEPFLKRASRGLSFFGETRDVAADILELMGTASGLERIAYFCRLLHVLAASEDFAVLSSEAFIPDLDPRTLAIVQSALTYVNANFDKDARLSELAVNFGMLESTFSRFFKKHVGTSFIGHVTKLRISRACKMLADTNEPITEVCYRVGYHNLSNFNRAFRTERGMTPSTYRRLVRHRITSVADHKPPPSTKNSIGRPQSRR